MSFTLLGILNAQASGGALQYWLSTLGGINRDFGKSVVTDSDGNSYTCGYSNNMGAGARDFLIAKYNLIGELQWQRTLGQSSDDEGFGIDIDSDNNLYVAGYGYFGSYPSGSNKFVIAKYNSSGTLQWQRSFGGSSSDMGHGISVDSANDVFIIGTTLSTGAGSDDLLLAKYNSSGTLQWQRSLGGLSWEYGNAIDSDSNNNVYVLGNTGSTGGAVADFLLAKYNSSGTLQWQRSLGGGGQDEGFGIAIDSTDSVYITGRSTSVGSGGNDFLIAKYESSGTLNWQRVIGGGSSDEAYAIALDSSDNAYLIGYTLSDGEGAEDFFIVKYSNTGVLQWQRVLGGTNIDIGHGITIDSNNDMHLYGYTLSTGFANYSDLQARLPSDGSLTGTYVLDGVNIVYAASALTAATSSLTSSTSSLSSATSSLTSSSSGLTQYLTGIG